MWNKADLYEALGCEPGPLLRPELERFAETPLGSWRAAQLEQLRERAREYEKTPIAEIPYRLFRLYGQTGDRAAQQALYFDLRGRLLVFSLLCWLEPEHPAWKESLEDAIWAVCAEPFWCVPAHFVGPGDVPLPFEEYATQLDLFACETAFALAEALVLCRDRLDAAVARQAELQIERRVFTPFLDGGRFFRFEGMRSNWSAVCGGAIGGAALHLMRDRARLASLLHRCLSCMEVYLDSFGGDGISVEGVEYWTYGFGFFTCFADLLAKRTGGRLDLFRLPKAQAIAQAQQHYYLTGGHTVSFADGSEQGGFRMGLSCWLQGRFAAALPDAACADSVLRDECHRFCLALRDFLWYDETTRFGLPASRSVWLAEAQWLISRGGSLTLAAKGGNNGESHNHNDCGSFILYKNGQPLLCDLGAGLYDAAYFGPHRYELFINASRSHNLPLPDGCEQISGVQHACQAVDARLEDGQDRLSMELSGCYGHPDLIRCTRLLVHDKAEGLLTLTDTLEFAREKPVTEVFVSQTPIRLQPGQAVFEREGVTLTLCFEPSRFTPSLHSEQYIPRGGGPARTAYLLHLSAAAAREHLCGFSLR